MKLIIKPYESIGVIKFGMTPEEVRAAVNSPYSSFMKTPFSAFPTDAFDEAGFHVYYDKNGKCEFVETFTPAIVIFQDKVISKQPFKLIKDWLETIADDVKPDDSGLDVRSLGFGLYAPDFDEEERPDVLVGSVNAYTKGYRDEYEKWLAEQPK